MKNSRITDIQIVPIKPQNGLIGFASFVLDNKYYLSSVAIYTKIDGSGYRLVYPSKKLGDKNISIFHPISKEIGFLIEKTVIQKVIKIFNKNLSKEYSYE